MYVNPKEFDLIGKEIDKDIFKRNIVTQIVTICLISYISFKVFYWNIHTAKWTSYICFYSEILLETE